MKYINKINKKKYAIIFLTVVGIVSLGGTIAYKKSYDSFLENAKNQTMKEQNIILSSFIGKNEKKLIYCLETWGYQLYSIGDNSKLFKKQPLTILPIKGKIKLKKYLYYVKGHNMDCTPKGTDTCHGVHFLFSQKRPAQVERAGLFASGASVATAPCILT